MIAAALGLALLLAADPPPPEELARARTAIDTARSAIGRADGGIRADAESLLADAVEHLKAARYAAAQSKADEAGQLVARDAVAPSKFTVRVSDGGTEVVHVDGRPIRVEDSHGTTRELAGGEKAVLEDTSGPVTLQAPSLLSPGDQARIKLKPTDRGLGPVTLTWTPVAGTKEYVVEFQAEKGKPSILRVQRPEARLPPLPQGRVQWAVRSVSDSGTSEPSSKRWFELEADRLAIEVKPGGWK